MGQHSSMEPLLLLGEHPIPAGEWTPAEHTLKPSSSKVAARYLTRQVRTRTAGEVIFKKDRGGDKSEWAWNDHAPTAREMDDNFSFKLKEKKPLVAALRSTMAALGHVNSAHTTFLKVKSARVSPDGNLGGRGYIQKIADMRRAYMNVSEALSALGDTLYDEINAPHWTPGPTADPREREKVKELVEDVEDIRQDPEAWAKEEEAEMDAEHSKRARRNSR